MRLFARLAVAFVLIVACGAELKAQQGSKDSRIKNRTFQWSGGELDHWEIAQGAGRGSRTSTTRKANDGSLELSGNSRTQTWNYVGQTISASAGDYLLFSYSAKAADIQRERGQNNNCYAGIFFMNRRGNVGNVFFTIHDNEFASHERVVEVPAGTTQARVTLFLSMTGTLNFKEVDVRPLAAEDSFDVLVSQMDRYYSYFDHKGVDWDELTEKYRDQATEAADADEFKKVVMTMLGELKDGHVWVMENNRRIPCWRQPRVSYNFNFGAVEKELEDVKKFGRLGLVARTDDNLGYIRITSLQTGPDEMNEMLEAVDDLYDTDGMIVDLRANGGGAEGLGMMLASRFCKEPVTYAINRFRKNEQHDEFYEFPRSPVQPRDGEVYDKPVVCLIGPGAVSSAEGTALMFKALPNVKLIGQPTRGSSGNPGQVKLPNGVEIWFSRWVACNAEGEPIEGRGVQPDIVVEHSDGDPTWERAREELK